MKSLFYKFLFLLCSIWISSSAAAASKQLKVCATIPDLGSLVREVGGEHVSVVVFAKGTEDAHFVDAKPSFIRELSQADLFIEVGMELEVGWAPPLLQNARNGRVLPGASGFLDASSVISPLGAPKGIVDRAMGDVHPAGNPHYLLDPENGIKVARLICDRLNELSPENRADFEAGFERFRKNTQEKMLHWLEAMKPFSGSEVVVDHNLWPYFAQRFSLQVSDSLEPKPGLQPTTKHLKEVITHMQNQTVKWILASAYYDPRHARFVAEKTGATVLPMAHQVGSRPGTDDYLSMMDYNIKQFGQVGK